MSDDPLLETMGKLVNLVATLSEMIDLLVKDAERTHRQLDSLLATTAQLGVSLATLRQSALAGDKLLAHDIEQLDTRLTSVHVSALRALNARLPGGQTA